VCGGGLLFAAVSRVGPNSENHAAPTKTTSD
jgi:hypothetical protein